MTSDAATVNMYNGIINGAIRTVAVTFYSKFALVIIYHSGSILFFQFFSTELHHCE